MFVRKALVAGPFLGLAVLLATGSPVAAAGSAAEGHLLARQWCSACHIVDAAQASGSADVPPFTEIAGAETLTADNLAAFLANPHPVMPDMALTRDEIADLVAYIRSLRSE